jgi:endonuclease-3
MAKPRTAKGRATETAARLAELYPGSAVDLCELEFKTPYQLLVATVLSAQTTDERVNSVLPGLFARYREPADLAHAIPEEVEALIRPTGFFRAKTKAIMGLAQSLDDKFGGEVPAAIEDLVTLPGVGRKTANVIRSVGFGLPGLAVDTHVTRLSRLLGLTDETDAVKIEADVCRLLPASQWGAFGLRVILHGRRVCVARRPRCDECALNDYCPSAGVTAVTGATKAAARTAAALRRAEGAGKAARAPARPRPARPRPGSAE